MALPRLLRKLYSLGSFTQSPGEWFIPRYVFKEELPLHFEGIFTRAWIDTGLGVFSRLWAQHFLRPTMALPFVPSTCIVNKSSRRTRTPQEELN